MKGLDNRAPDFLRIVFNPARFREVLSKFAIRSHDFLVIDEHSTATHSGRAGIDSHDVRRATHGERFLGLCERYCDGPVDVRLVGAGRVRLGVAFGVSPLLDAFLLARGGRTGV